MAYLGEMSGDEILHVERNELKREHAETDARIHGLEVAPVPDRLAISRLKKHKLALKDRIARIEDRLFPDIIA